MHLVARRAELRRLLLVERLQENFAMRLRIDIGELVVRGAQERILAGREIVQRGGAHRRSRFPRAPISCRGGYSIAKSPCPIVLRTEVIACHEEQASPACAS